MKSFNTNHNRLGVLALIALLMIAGCDEPMVCQTCLDREQDISTFMPHEPLPSRSNSPIEPGVFDLVRVVDGDTLIVGNADDRSEQFRIRLIAADVPELARGSTPAEPFAQEAMDFTTRMIEMAGNRVRIAYDGEELDKWRRTRALVYLTMPDGSEMLLNEELIRQGYAHVRLQFSYSQSLKLKFAVAEIETRKHRRNIWSLTAHP